MDNNYKMTEWDHQYLTIADFIGKMSKCAAKGVGAIIVKNNNIVSSGVNGTPSGYTNCNEIFQKKDSSWYSALAQKDESDFIITHTNELYPVSPTDLSHHDFSFNHEIHAEINAISKMAKAGISTEDTSLYCNYSPCITCAKSIIASGITKVFYIHPYDDVKHVTHYLTDNNVLILQQYHDGKEE